MSVRVEVRGFDAAAERLARVEDAVSRDGLSRALRGVSLRVYTEILTRSPVDTGRYRANWSPPNVSESGDVVEAVIRNNLKYAHPVTYGSVKGQRPWPKAGPKTVEQDGRVYSSQAVGGVIDPVLDGWADAVMDEILKGLDE